MNNITKRGISAMLCTLIFAGTAGTFAYSAPDSGVKAPIYDAKTISREADNEKSTGEKVETVYVLAGADGSAKQVIVSGWLKNPSGAQTITDIADLKNIENVKGDETFGLGSDSTVTWNAGGNDIYFRGTSEKELPISISVSYKLDGEDISPADLKGKSGKVTIRFDYTASVFEEVMINGKRERIYVPFAVLTGTILDNDVFRNVEVKNGRIINDGSRTIAAGIALPKMQENLGIDSEKLELPDYIEITADVTDFRMGMTASIAANQIFSGLDLSMLDSADGLEDSLSQLTDAMGQLTDGSSQLYDGLCALLESSQELVSGIDKLAEGSKSLADGTRSLSSGTSELKSGSAQLSEGMQALVKNNSSLNGGAKQVFDSLIASANARLQASGLPLPALTTENYGAVLGQAISATGSPELTALKAQLDSYSEFYNGLLSYTAGVSQACDGAKKLDLGIDSLNSGSAQLESGAQELCGGLSKLKENTPALIEGITQLRDGSKQLSDGVKEFSEQGIQKIVSAFDGDFASLKARIEATVKASRGYRSFSGINSDMDGSVKFFFRTDAIE